MDNDDYCPNCGTQLASGVCNNPTCPNSPYYTPAPPSDNLKKATGGKRKSRRNKRKSRKNRRKSNRRGRK